jgi:DNA invertase Pin-like site-specific DNA recombinase
MTARIEASHLGRRACVYVRQSTVAQVFEHGESTERQYALTGRAAALGWTEPAIEVIDEDLGHSGATTEGRTGFARLVDGVVRGEIGAIFAIEVSRLARSSMDWQRLLALCAVAEVVVADEQAVYDPGNTDDKLLLDIKGTMSEAELHWIRLRLHGALQSKARRGELRIGPPTGYVWGGRRFELDPDESVQAAIRLVFERYSVEPSAYAVARWAQRHGVQIPVRRNCVGGRELVWSEATARRVVEIIRNPVYAGVYVYGRRHNKKVIVDGEIRYKQMQGRDPEQWPVRIDGTHVSYISWEQYLKNQQKLRNNLCRSVTQGAPRDGDALLSGLLLCGQCGYRVGTTYSNDGLHYYRCYGEPPVRRACTMLPGRAIDRAVEQLFLNTMVPQELELSLAVEREVDAKAQSLDRHWTLRVERAEYEARHAERRYKAVDPDNRVVARTLEGEWERCLSELEQVRTDYERAKREQRVELTELDRERIRALARDLPNVWRSPTTRQADRKAMLRLVIEAVSLRAIEVPRRETSVRIAWKSGAVTELRVPRPTIRELISTPEAALMRLRELAAASVHDQQIAERLDAEGFITGMGKRWNLNTVRNMRSRHRIPRTAPSIPPATPLPDRREDGCYSVLGAARHYGVGKDVIRLWIAKGAARVSRQSSKTGARGAIWLHVDEETEARLHVLAEESRQRTSRRRKATTKKGPTTLK